MNRKSKLYWISSENMQHNKSLDALTAIFSSQLASLHGVNYVLIVYCCCYASVTTRNNIVSDQNSANKFPSHFDGQNTEALKSIPLFQ